VVIQVVPINLSTVSPVNVSHRQYIQISEWSVILCCLFVLYFDHNYVISSIRVLVHTVNILLQ